MIYVINISFSSSTDRPVSVFLRSPETVRDFLIRNMSFSPDLVDMFLAAKVNSSQVIHDATFKMLKGNVNLSM